MRKEYLIRKITAYSTVSEILYSNLVTCTFKQVIHCFVESPKGYAESNHKLVLVITRWAQSGAQSLNGFVPDCNAKASKYMSTSWIK